MATEVDNIAVPSFPGARRIIEYAFDVDGKAMPAKMFLIDELPEDTCTDVLAKFKHLAENGEQDISSGIFCRERDDIWTFKHKLNKRRLRFPCFRYGNRWIVTHGFFKPGQSKWPEKEFKRANALKDLWLEREAAKKK